MDHRERVMRAVNHEEPDTIPTALWGSFYGIPDELYFQLVFTAGLDSPVLPFRRNKAHAINYYDERILSALDVDVRYADCGFTDLGGPSRSGGRDAWGIRYEEEGHTLNPVDFPLAEASLDDISSFSIQSLWKYLRLDEFREEARKLKEETDFAVVGRAFDSFGPFRRCCSLLKPGQFIADLNQDEDFSSALIQKVTEIQCKILEFYLGEAGKYLDIIELPGDDFAEGMRPVISPRTFDHFFAPAYKRMMDLIHEAAPGCKVLFHSDGNLEPFLSRLISLGIDIYHGVEPLPGVDFIRLKEEYGNQVCFWGGIDIHGAMMGSPERVEEEVHQRIEQLAHDGGYVLAPVNHLRADTPPENVFTLYESARKLGKRL